MNENTALTLIVMSIMVIVGLGVVNINTKETTKYTACVTHHSPAECK